MDRPDFNDYYLVAVMWNQFSDQKNSHNRHIVRLKITGEIGNEKKYLHHSSLLRFIGILVIDGFHMPQA